MLLRDMPIQEFLRLTPRQKKPYYEYPDILVKYTNNRAYSLLFLEDMYQTFRLLNYSEEYFLEKLKVDRVNYKHSTIDNKLCEFRQKIGPLRTDSTGVRGFNTSTYVFDTRPIMPILDTLNKVYCQYINDKDFLDTTDGRFIYYDSLTRQSFKDRFVSMALKRKEVKDFINDSEKLKKAVSDFFQSILRMDTEEQYSLYKDIQSDLQVKKVKYTSLFPQPNYVQIVEEFKPIIPDLTEEKIKNVVSEKETIKPLLNTLRNIQIQLNETCELLG